MKQGEESKVAVITGATSGIGRACANRLLDLGYQVHILGRNLTSVYSEEIVESYPVVLWECDYADLKTVHSRLKECLTHLSSIHLILHASGIVVPDYQETIDGIEMQFQVNYLVQFFITELLIDRLCEDGIICLIGSEEHRKATFDLKDLYMKSQYESRSMYQRSKLCQVLYASKLDSLFDYETGGGVVVVHPGTVNTGFGGKQLSGLKKWFWELYGTLREGKTAGEAADIIMKVIEFDPYNRGLYYHEVRSVQISALAKDSEIVNQLYETSTDLIKQLLLNK